MMRFWIGETVRVRANFTDEAGAPLTASGVAFTARTPSGQTVIGSPVAIPQQQGGWYADFPLDQAGRWSLRASCSGPTAAAVEDQVEARASFVL